MTIVRQNGFNVVDYTQYVDRMPRVYTLVQDMGLFEERGVIGRNVQVERVLRIGGEMTAVKRGSRGAFHDSDDSLVVDFTIPYFADDQPITDFDLQNFREFGTANTPRTVNQFVGRQMMNMRARHARTKETAMLKAILGESYNPLAGGITYNYYDQFGVTQALAPVDFTDVSTDPRAVIEKDARKHIQEQAMDGAANYEIVAFCGSAWFDALIAHPKVEEAYVYYDSRQEPLRGRLNGNHINRMFKTKGVMYIEVIDPKWPTGSAAILPSGIDNHFEIVYGSLSGLPKYANSVGKELYLEFAENEYLREAVLRADSAMLAINKRPELTVLSVGKFA